MLTGKQRSYLRSLANGIDSVFQVGKGGVNDNMIKQFNEALEARELIKVTVLKNSLEDVREVCDEAARLTGSEVVQVIGNKFVLYKESKENKVIELPQGACCPRTLGPVFQKTFNYFTVYCLRILFPVFTDTSCIILSSNGYFQVNKGKVIFPNLT